MQWISIGLYHNGQIEQVRDDISQILKLFHTYISYFTEKIEH